MHHSLQDKHTAAPLGGIEEEPVAYSAQHAHGTGVLAAVSESVAQAVLH